MIADKPAGVDASAETLRTSYSSSAVPNPIFVIAPPGMAGETVAAMLGQHPECWGIAEANLELGGNLDGLMRDMIGLRSSQLHGLLRTLSQLLTGEQTVVGIDAARRWLSRHAYLPTSAVWHLIAQRIAPRRIVAPLTTSLFETVSLERLVKTFPNAQFVAIKMHPKSYGQAIMAQHGGAAAWLLGAVDESVFPKLPAPTEIWDLAEEGISDLSEMVSAKQIIRVRIEDIAHQRQITIPTLLFQLGLNASDTCVAAMQHPERSAFCGPGPFGANSGGNILSLSQLSEQIPGLDELSLFGPAPWRPDGMPIPKETQKLAVALGYS